MRLSPLAGVLVLAGCGGTETTAPPGNMQPPVTKAAAFNLQDVNATSPTFGMSVSPRDQLGKVSAWYFGHAT